MPAPALADAGIFFCENFLQEVEIFLLIVRVNVSERRIIFKIYIFAVQKLKEQIINVAIGQVVFEEKTFSRNVIGIFKLIVQILAEFYVGMKFFFGGNFFGHMDMSERYQKFVVD